ncbi:type 4b pilus protein PilO2 [Escherichia coli]|nr:type 4b pilus protein PilO2 [Escherichia coli]
MMTKKTNSVTINSKVYAINLIWNSVSPNEKAHKAACSAAQIINAKLGCITDTLIGYQYGLADSNAEYKQGMYVLAAELASVENSVCGVWRVDDFWIVIAIDSNGQVIIDKGYTSAEYAKTEFENLVYSDNWNNIYCPNEWGIHNSKDVPIAFVLLNSRKKLKLKKLNAFKYSKKKGGVVLLVLFVLFMFVLNSFFIKEEQINNANEDISTVHNEPLPAPWEGKLKPLPAIKECIEAINTYMMLSSGVPGWRWNGLAHCDGYYVDYGLIPDGGINLWLEYAAKIITPPPLIDKDSNERAIIKWPVNDMPKYSDERIDLEDFVRIESIKKYIANAFESVFTTVKMSSIIMTTNNLGYIDVSYRTESNPLMYISLFEHVYGATMQKVSFTEQGEWEVSIRLYGKI